MKILCTADVHLHAYKEFDKPSDVSGSYRLDKVVDTLRYMRDYCTDNEIRHVVCAGDLFHVRSKIDVRVYNATYELLKSFKEHGISVYLLAGNHDQIDNSDIAQSSLKPLSALDSIWVFEKYDKVLLDDVQLDFVPFSKNTKLVVDTINNIPDDEYKHVLVTHLGISGAVVGKNSYPLQDAFTYQNLRPEFFQFVVLGHYHKRQFINGSNHVFYCGSPIQHSFNDEGEGKGFFIIDTEKNTSEFVEIPNPQFHTVTSDTTQEQLAEYKDRGDYLRVQLSESEVDKFQEIVPDNLDYKVELTKEYIADMRVDVQIGMSFENMISKYAEEFYPEAKEIGLNILKEVGEK